MFSLMFFFGLFFLCNFNRNVCVYVNNVVNFACVPQVHIIIIYLINRFFLLPAKSWNFRRFPFFSLLLLLLSLWIHKRRKANFIPIFEFISYNYFVCFGDEWKKKRACLRKQDILIVLTCWRYHKRQNDVIIMKRRTKFIYVNQTRNECKRAI